MIYLLLDKLIICFFSSRAAIEEVEGDVAELEAKLDKVNRPYQY